MTRSDGVADPMSVAISVFTRKGYESTSVADIADAAGVSRSTFFRRYRSKEDVVFADHEVVLERVEAYLTSTGDAPLDAVCAAARMVFDHHVAKRDMTVPRFALLRAVPELRDRELVTSHRYERAFVNHLQRTIERPDDLEYAVVAFSAAVVAVHNRVLRAWLQHPDQPLAAALTTQLRVVVDMFRGAFFSEAEPRRALVAVFDTSLHPDDLVESLRSSLGPHR